jgi:hypothetical protein
MNNRNEGQVASEYEKFLNLLPWYLNNTLSREDKTWVDGYIASHPDAAVDLELERSLASQTINEVAHLPEDAGFSELMRRVRLDRTKTVKLPAPQNRSIKDLFLSTFGGFFVTLGRPGASIAVTALAVVQAGIIASILMTQHQPAETVYRSLAPPNTKLLGVQIRPTTTEQEFRQLFVNKNIEIVGGPSQIGEYRISVPKNNFDQVAEQLEQSPFVESVTVIKNDTGY